MRVTVDYIVAAGCSFVAGTSLTSSNSEDRVHIPPEDQIKHRFSKLVADKFNAQEINLANSGGSNGRAIRRIYEWTKENPEKIKDTVFILGLTELFRKEKYCANTKSFIKWRNTAFFDRIEELDIQTHSPKVVPGSFAFVDYIKQNNLEKEVMEYAKTDILLFSDIDYEFKALGQNLDMLNSYIISLGGELIVFAAMLELEENLELQFHITGTLDTANLNFMTFPGGYKNWKSYISSYDKDYSWSFHPCIKDDEILADLLFKHIQNE